MIGRDLHLSLLLLSIRIFTTNPATAQLDSVKENYRKAILVSSTSALFAGGMIGLHQLWYEDYPRSSFHTFDDGGEWLQVDKAGHVFSTYISAKYGMQAFRWAGYSGNTATLIGGSIGLFFLTGVEIMDGYSKEWGFSTYDMGANVAGTALAIGQQFLFDKQILKLKFSYHPTVYSDLRPALLGENDVQAFFKDYNGQTYWASFNLNDVYAPIKPAWLNLSVGYGGSGMFSADPPGTPCSIPHQRQFYLAPDIDLEKIPTDKIWLKRFFTYLNWIKIPAPTLEWKNGNMQFHPLYF
jgi:hypothetical protein